MKLTSNLNNILGKTVNDPYHRYFGQVVGFEVNGLLLVEFLMLSKLKCFYCREVVELIYRDVRAKKQWTLDRKDNDYGHNRDNVVIACLDCNLKRGIMDMEKFKFTKQLKIVKT